MSATFPLRKAAAAPARPRRTPTSVARPRLTLISSPRRDVARGPFLILVGALMLGGLLALLLLHTLAAQDAFQQTTLQHRLSALTDTEQQLEQQVQIDAAPSALLARARALGMVPSTITSFHRGANGRTIAHLAPVAPVAAASTTTQASSTSTTKSTSTAMSSSKSTAHGKSTSPTKSTPKAATSKNAAGSPRR